MSYYKIIDGKRYERELLEIADVATRDQGDGRISRDDAKKLIDCALDGRGITAIEARTLGYILANYQLTDAASSFIQASLTPNSMADIPTDIQKVLVEDLELEGLSWQISPEDVREQTAFPGNTVGVEIALREVVRSLTEDGSDVESPRSLIALVEDLNPAFFPSEDAYEMALQERVIFYLKDGGELRLLPFDAEIDFDEIDYNPPENGESVQENWIFSLSLPELSDHIYWVIIDRSGQEETYNYGFN